MKKRSHIHLVLTAASLLVVLANLSKPVFAQRGEPGSLLLMPEYDNRPGTLTLLTVTNTATDAYDICVRFFYISAEDCNHFTRDVVLTPRDTLSVLTNVHNPNNDRGFVYIYACDIDHPDIPISHNYLVGTCMTLDGTGASQYSLDPFVFEAIWPDVGSDDVRDFDGVEYEQAAGELLFPRFLGQNYDSPDTELILINLTGTREFTTEVALEVWNDNSDKLSDWYTFHCWDRVRLADVSEFFENEFLRAQTQHDADEILGETGWESGWFSIDGQLAHTPSRRSWTRQCWQP